MKTLVWKEVRLILPAWLMAMLLAMLPVWFFSATDLIGWQSEGALVAFYSFGLGAVFLGLAPFGQECALGTFSTLLAQPAARLQVWRTKVGVGVTALGSAWLTLLLCYSLRIQALPSRHILAVCGLIALVALAGGLWTTLLFRQVAAALWFSLLLPPVILITTSRLWNGCSDNAAFVGLSAELMIYAITGLFLAQRLFLRAQDTAWTGGAVALPIRLGFGGKARAITTPSMRTPIRALVRKEFQSHHFALLLAGGMLLLHLLMIFIRRIEYDPMESNSLLHSLLEFWWVQWLGLPLLVGSAAVAEERKLGTLEPQLCLPTTRRIQFAIKFGVALALGVVLGGVMPWLAEGITGLEVAPGTFHNARDIALWQPFALTCLVSAAITVVSFYASTLMRNLLQAMAGSVAVGLGLNAFGAWAVAEAFGGSSSPHLWVGLLVIYIGLPTLLAVLLWLAFRNFKHVYVGSGVWRYNLLAVLGAMIFAVVTTTLVYNRAWEYFMSLEPRHGPARLSGPVKPRICAGGTHMIHRFPDGREVVGYRPFLLLPDGRLWAANQYRLQPTGDYVSVRDHAGRRETRQQFDRAIPVGGHFLSLSNWVDLASSGVFGWADQAAGIRSDGTLWNIFTENGTNWQTSLSEIPTPERIGTDSDWKRVVGGGTFFVALKSDGSLWGWGGNESGQLGRAPIPDIPSRVFSARRNFINGLVRIGEDSDWVSVFATRSIVTGVKRDGSVWRWGYLDSAPPGYVGHWTPGPHPKPLRWDLDGSRWQTLTDMRNFDLILEQDGTLWVTGHIWGNLSILSGRRLFESGDQDHFFSKPEQIGSGVAWADISGEGSLVGLMRTGAVVQSAGWGLHLAAWGEAWKPSKYSDWIAIASHGWDSVMTLAADGTLCAWRDPGLEAYANLTPRNDQEMLGMRLLGPSRRPLWAVNIFADAK